MNSAMSFLPSKATSTEYLCPIFVSINKFLGMCLQKSLLYYYPPPPHKLFCYPTLQKITFSKHNLSVNFDFLCLSRACLAIFKMTQNLFDIFQCYILLFNTNSYPFFISLISHKNCVELCQIPLKNPKKNWRYELCTAGRKIWTKCLNSYVVNHVEDMYGTLQASHYIQQ